MKATKAALREEIARLRYVGAQMSNVCFNLGQHANRVIGPNDAAIMMQVCKEWDAVKRSEKPEAQGERP